MDNNSKNTFKPFWKKPIITTISKKELQEKIKVSACSEYSVICPLKFFR